MGACFFCLDDQSPTSVVVEINNGVLTRAYSICESCIIEGDKLARERAVRKIETDSNPFLPHSRAIKGVVPGGVYADMRATRDAVIHDALEATSWNFKQAAKMLGVSRYTLYRWRKQAQ